MKTINSFSSKLLALTLALMASLSTFASDDHSRFLCCTILTDSTVAITGQSEYKTVPRYEYLPENLVIPAEVTLQGKTYKVVSIDQWAFYACTMLKSVTIPSSVTFIGLSAFQYCENLVNVDIPTNVTTVEGSAFSYTKWYDNLPDGEVYINNTLYRYKGTAPENTQIVVKDGTTRIAGFTFWNQSNIVSIELPQSLTNIEHGAFEGCTQLSSILIPKNVAFIGCSAFAKCTGLMEVICLAPTPPIAGVSANPSPSDWMFAGVDVANVLLYVPVESIELYRNADQWKDFGQILPIESTTSYKSQWCDTWNVMWFDGMRFDETASTSQYRLGKDTIIGDYTYSKFTSRTSVRFTNDRKVYVYYEGFDDNDPYTEDLPTGEYLAYDFSAQVGDTLEVFSGSHSYTTEQCVVYDVQTDPETNLRTIMLHPLRVVDSDGNVGVSNEEITWLEGVGSPNGFLISTPPTGGGLFALLCAYKGDELKYTGPLYEEYGCEYNAGPFNEKLLGTWRVVGGNEIISISDSIIVFIGLTQKYTASATQLTVERLWIPEEESYRWANCNYTLSNDTLWIDNFMPLLVATYPPTFGPITLVKVKHEDLFPTLWGLQRTGCTKTIGENENGTVWGSRSYLMQETQTTTIDGKQYMVFGDDQYNRFALREENNKILVYSSILKKDLVLYDFTLEVGDSLPALYFEERAHDTMQQWLYIGDIVDYNKDDDGTILPAETFVVTDISTITLLDGKEYKKWTFDNGMEYVEGIGSFGTSYAWNDFYQLIANGPLYSDVHSQHLVCVSKNGQLLYKMDDAEMEQLETECLCEYNTEQKPEDLFPTLWGLQQTICSGYYGEEGDEWASGLTGPSQEITMMDGKPYLQWGSWYLREENDKILVYSEIQKKDLVLYDFTLELGDTLTTLNLVTPEFLEYEGIVGIVDYPLSDYDYTYPIDTLVVTELSKETLLDGKEYTRWKFSDGTVYVEGIGSMNETFFHHIADHLPVPVSYLGSYLVCVSKNNKLLYQMDPVKMDELGAECLCDYNRGPRKDNAKDGQIGGRPTPTQWNQLEVVLRQMDNNHTILQAETFSYTLEDISQQVNNKTYFQLARQSTKDTATTKSVVGALHFGKEEDNRVYFLRDGVEYVLYDFTAEPGDTIEIFAGINNYPQETTYTHVVVDKDTTEDGVCRMFLEVVFPDETATATNAEKVWLAGLGSIDGVVHNSASRATKARSSETQTSVMLCAWREDSCLYTTNHPDYDTFGCVYNQDPTSVEDISTSKSSYQKIIREGQFLILHNGKTYSIMGIEL